MAGQKFQYDESGNTFFYFILSIWAILLIPITYYWWPKKHKHDGKNLDCRCDACRRKEVINLSNKPYKGTKNSFTKLFIILGWITLLFLAYKVSQYENEYANFDPYQILGISSEASPAEIRKSYRKLSLILHPDKETGDEKAFMMLTKAYQALTDDVARENWEKYGNPDGPGAINFGIALPSWIVDEKNSIWVLGLYALVFIIALPIVVGTWWYKSIRYSSENVLLDTTQIYFFFFRKTPFSMSVKRALMILAASFEFHKKFNKEMVERISDEVEIPQLMKKLPYLSEKNREFPLFCVYSIKARSLLHAHLSRIPLNPETLDKDRQNVVRKCPTLIQEMINCVSQAIALARAHHIPKIPNIETVENVMKLSPMIVQAMWDNKSPFLQLPHITEDKLRCFSYKKKYIKSIQQFAAMKPEDQKNILKSFTDEECADIMKVMSRMPLVEFHVVAEVVDDENPDVYTAGAIITVRVTLIRRNLCDIAEEDYERRSVATEPTEDQNEQQQEGEGSVKAEEQTKKPVWQKPQKKGKKVTKKNAKNTKHAARSSNKKSETKTAETSENKETVQKNDDDDNASDSDEEKNSSGGDDSTDNENGIEDQKDEGKSFMEDDDDEWKKFHEDYVLKREKALEGRKNYSHSVHCPYFPLNKQEFWWVYVCDRKNHMLMTPLLQVTNLVDKERVELKLTAPKKPGLYTFTACLRSDSYLGFDQTYNLKLDIKEAPKEPVDHPQWKMPEDDEDDDDKDDGIDLSEYTTDEDV